MLLFEQKTIYANLSRAFSRRGKPDQEPEPEKSTNLIEIMPVPPRRTPDN